jgi:hypothetical protein
MSRGARANHAQRTFSRNHEGVSMQYKREILRAIASAVAGVATLVFVVCAMLTFAPPEGQATPVIAKGKPCTTCHAGSPPNKSNLKTRR